MSGDVDGGAVPAFETELRRVITTKLPRLVVDLRRVRVMEPAGIDVLVNAHDLAVERGGWVRTSGAGQSLADLLRAIGPVHYPTLAEALPAYRRAI